MAPPLHNRRRSAPASFLEMSAAMHSPHSPIRRNSPGKRKSFTLTFGRSPLSDGVVDDKMPRTKETLAALQIQACARGFHQRRLHLGRTSSATEQTFMILLSAADMYLNLEEAAPALELYLKIEALPMSAVQRAMVNEKVEAARAMLARAELAARGGARAIEECAICMEAMDEQVQWPAQCGHAFCRSCVKRCFQADPDCRCPMCRQAPPQKSTHIFWTLQPTPSGGLTVNMHEQPPGDTSQSTAGSMPGDATEVGLNTNDVAWLIANGPPRGRRRLRLGRPRPQTLPVRPSQYRYRGSRRPGFFTRALMEMGSVLEEVFD
jgi:hypothetical protein